VQNIGRDLPSSFFLLNYIRNGERKKEQRRERKRERERFGLRERKVKERREKRREVFSFLERKRERELCTSLLSPLLAQTFNRPTAKGEGAPPGATRCTTTSHANQ